MSRAVLGRLRTLFERAGSKMPVAGAMLTDVGAVREGNEDSVAYLLRPEADLAIVADGMGGHAAGEEASRIAIDTIARVFFEASGSIPRRLAVAFQAANGAILARAANDADLEGMGTTCTALAFANDEVFLAHVGDSRAYRVRDGAITQLSRDHSLVADLVARGALTESEAAESPDKNIILRAMGIAPSLEPQIPPRGEKLRDGDVYVLCSDGLSDLVPLAAIEAAASTLAPQEACEALLEASIAAGGHDNVSVGVFRAGTTPPAPPPARTREVEVRA